MKAIIYEKYGTPDVLEFKEIEKPIPKNNEVLIKIHACSLNSADARILQANPFVTRLISGLFKPHIKILGADVAGIIEAVGKDVTMFKPGDEVYGDLALHGFGGLAEYVCVKQHVISQKPENFTFEEAATLPMASVTALQAIRDAAKVQPGQDILINGAGGGVGLFAVQLVKFYNAKLTAVCGTHNVELVKSLGADLCIDYTKEDFVSRPERYDCIFGINGYHTLKEYVQCLNTHGKYFMVGGDNAQIFEALLLGPIKSLGSTKKISAFSANVTSKDLAFIKNLCEQGKLKTIIDKKYKLHETADAFRYLNSKHVKGKVVISIA